MPKVNEVIMTHNSPTAVSRDSIESAYCFIHQKLRVYEYSSSPVQRDDIEYAISQYVGDMNAALYAMLASEKADYLLDHTTFGQDMRDAQEKLEKML